MAGRIVAKCTCGTTDLDRRLLRLRLFRLSKISLLLACSGRVVFSATARKVGRDETEGFEGSR